MSGMCLRGVYLSYQLSLEQGGKKEETHPPGHGRVGVLFSLPVWPYRRVLDFVGTLSEE